MLRLFSFTLVVLFTLCSTHIVTLQDYRQTPIICSEGLSSTCLGRNYLNSSREGQQSYNFSSPEEAFEILNELDFSPQIVLVPPETPKRYRPFLGVKNQSDYCQRHRAYFVENPDFIFNQFNFFIEESAPSFLRSQVFQPIGHDMHPNVSAALPQSLQSMPLYDLRPDVSLYFTKNDMHSYLEVGTQSSCLTQQYNHIPGHSYLVRKDLVARSALRYAENFIGRPHCFDHRKLFPETWLLHNMAECQDFFTKLNSKEYEDLKAERRIVYIRKNGKVTSHRGEGVQPVNEQEEEELRRDYDNGRNCGIEKKNYIVQSYIHNPLLLNGHKFDFRMYMLVASANPLIAYYHDGFLRVTLASYDVNSDEKKVLLTNLALNKQIYNEVKLGNLYEGRDEETLKRAQQWSFDQLQTYLLERKIINDTNWLDNYLRPKFKKAMIHLLRMSSQYFEKRSSFYELYGVDFMLDTNLNLWFIEANAGPAFKGYSEPMEEFILKMLRDHLEIVTGLLKSRTKRIINYVNRLIQERAIQKGNDSDMMSELEEGRMAFKRITMNYFEEEFEPKVGNGFSKIVDKNYPGTRMYQGFIEESCLLS